MLGVLNVQVIAAAQHCLIKTVFVYIASAVALILALKPLIQVVYFVDNSSLVPSPKSSTLCQQTFPCCALGLVWLALGAREIPYDCSCCDLPDMPDMFRNASVLNLWNIVCFMTGCVISYHLGVTAP